VSDHDELRHLLGGYVLGGLTPEDRSRLETHLATCPECRAELGRYAPLPGLLRQAEGTRPEAHAAEGTRPPAARDAGVVPGDEVSPPEPPLPPEMLQRLLAAVRHRQSVRRRWLLAAAAAVVAFVVAGTWLTWSPDDDEPAAESPPSAEGTVVSFEPVGDWECMGEAELVEKAWGTELVLTASSLPERGPFSLAVIGVDGTEQLAATWGPTPAGRASVSGATSIQRADIASVRVVGPDGPLLDARMPP
jgi:hypothetical protein